MLLAPLLLLYGSIGGVSARLVAGENDVETFSEFGPSDSSPSRVSSDSREPEEAEYSDVESAYFESFCVLPGPYPRLGVCAPLRRCREPQLSQDYCRAGTETCCLSGDVSPVDLPPKAPTRVLPSDCGRPADLMPLMPMPRIAGGRSATESEWPWIVRFGLQPERRRDDVEGWEALVTRRRARSAEDAEGVQWFCGGALVTPSAVVTAAHCMRLTPDQRRRLVLSLGGQFHEVADITIHPGYRAMAKHADLAIVRLRRPVPVRVSPVCLPESNASFVGLPATVAGWGRQGVDGAPSDNLLEVEVSIEDPTACEAAYRTVADFDEMFPGGFSGTKLCAGGDGRDACRGDSGGPLVVTREDGARVLVGVVSTGYKCATDGYPGIYTRVAAYIDWILSHV